MLYSVALEGFEGRDVAVELAGVFSVPKILIDGEQAPKGEKAGDFVLRRNDGREAVARLRTTNFVDPVPQLIVDDRSHQLVEPLKWYQWIWGGLPILLLVSGGALGGLLGSIGLFINSRLFRSGMNPVLKYVATAGVSIGLGVTVFAIALALRLALPDWFARPETLTSTEGRFTVVAPVHLVQQIQDVDLPTGDTIKVTSYSGERSSIGYFVSYADYPQSVIRTNKPQTLLQGSRDGVSENLGGTITQDTEIALGEHPGREFIVTAKDEKGKPFTVRVRLYIVGARLYELIVWLPESAESGKDVETFFSTFAVSSE